ncbi:MAG: hypothetical protein AB7F79_08300 [Steroidobacteraceae bacterium]
MLPGRAINSSAGKTRVCPHCRSTILDSATICPACQHHLQFNPGQQAVRPIASFNALHVEGTVRHPDNEPPWEYSLVVAVRNQHGEEIDRKVIGVGALNSGDERTVSVNLEVFKTNKPTMR